MPTKFEASESELKTKFDNFRLLLAINCLLYSFLYSVLILNSILVVTVNRLQKESLVNNSHDSGVDSMNTNSSGTLLDYPPTLG